MAKEFINSTLSTESVQEAAGEENRKKGKIEKFKEKEKIFQK